MKKKYVLAGASKRAYDMFALPMLREYPNHVSIDGIFDINPLRSAYIAEACDGAPVFSNFDEMLRIAKPDAVIVTTVDAFHHEYIIKALRAGCDAITEKPMTIDAEKVRMILRCEKETGRKVRVTFNYRFMPYMTRIKELIAGGAIGDVFSVDFEWLLDRIVPVNGHGASYFRRWNRYLDKSGGLMVHKSTHHFDLINWWLQEKPTDVGAFAKLRFYGKNRKEHGERCSNCRYAGTCEFYWDISKNQFESGFYAGTESADGYQKDSCVFSEDIDIYDTMAVSVQYDGGAVLSYSLNATSPYEGFRMAINGSGGRLEGEVFETGILSREQVSHIRVFDLAGNMTTHSLPEADGDHGGGDVRIRRMLFVGDLPDPMGHMAGSTDGALSVLIGAAANISVREKRIVCIDELLGDPSLLDK